MRPIELSIRLLSIFGGILGLYIGLEYCSKAAVTETQDQRWKIIVANDTCPDVTWGYTENQTRQAFADLIAAHLDEMNRTDASPRENQNHYNLVAFIEAESFLEKFPNRKEEFLHRVRKGQICMSPFLCNTLWGMQSIEGIIRSFYPARRFERLHGISLSIAGHTELPSLPWGIATILSGCGIRWTSIPFLDYDSTFRGLTNPPLFQLEGPDGCKIRVILDAWASLKANYTQGGFLLNDPQKITRDWLPHYHNLGPSYPLKTIFASGTHSDINPNSWKQVKGFSDRIAEFNATNTNPVKLVNGTLAQFCEEVDQAEQRNSFMPTIRGCFGHSWELWPISLAATAASMRACEREFLAAESLVAIALLESPGLAEQTRMARERAEWCWARSESVV